MNKTISKKRALLLVAGLSLVNAYIIGGLFGTNGFNAGRGLLAAWGGWYLVSKLNANLWFAALVGIIIMVVDHIILKGGAFLLAQVFWPETVQNQGFMAFIGVLISFVMFAPIIVLISLASGFVGRKKVMVR